MIGNIGPSVTPYTSTPALLFMDVSQMIPSILLHFWYWVKIKENQSQLPVMNELLYTKPVCVGPQRSDLLLDKVSESKQLNRRLRGTAESAANSLWVRDYEQHLSL